MATAARWLTDTEKRLFENLILAKGVQKTYPTFTDLADKMEIDNFLKYCSDLDPAKVPKNFKQNRATMALKNTLITMGEAQIMVSTKTKELTDRVKQLEQALTKANLHVTHLNKDIRINNAKLAGIGRQPSQTAAQTPKPTKKHPYGLKTKSEYCQLCWLEEAHSLGEGL